MREKIKRQKPNLTDEQKKVIVELHKTTALKVIAKKIDVPYQWAYKWSVENGLELKYCRKVEKSNKMHVEIKGDFFDWEHYQNGETIMLAPQSKQDILNDLKEPKTRQFLQLFPSFGDDIREYVKKSNRLNLQ